MQIFNSYFLVAVFMFGLIIYPLLRTIFKRKKITSSVITYNIIHTMLLLPIPNMLLIKRQLFAVGGQSVDDMMNQFESRLDHSLVLINQFFMIYLIILCMALIYTTKGFKKSRFTNNIWFFLIMIFNTGLIYLEFNVTRVVYLGIFSIILLLGRFRKGMIKPIYTLLMLTYFYLSFLLILVKPKATIFQGGEWSGIFLNPNGGNVVAGFTLILLLLSYEYKWVKRFQWLYFHIVFIFFMVFMSGSRNGLLTIISIFLFYIIFKYKLGVKVSILIISLFIISPLFFSSILNINLAEITSLRWLIWENAINSLKNNFLFGNGNDFYSLNNRINKFPDQFLFVTNSYSSFIDFIVFYGMIGLIIILGFTISFYRKLKAIDIYFLSFFILFIIPNLFESYFKPPNFDLHNIIFLIMILIVESTSKSFKKIKNKKFKIIQSHLNEHSHTTHLPQQKR